MNFQDFLGKVNKRGNYPTRPVNPEADNIETPQEKMADSAKESVGIDKKILNLNEQQLKVLKEIREKLVPFAAGKDKEEDKDKSKPFKFPKALLGALGLLGAGGLTGFLSKGANASTLDNSKPKVAGSDNPDGSRRPPTVTNIEPPDINTTDLEKKIVKGVAAATAAGAGAYGANKFFNRRPPPKVEPRLGSNKPPNRVNPFPENNRRTPRVPPRLTPFERVRNQILQAEEDKNKKREPKLKTDKKGGRPPVDRDKKAQIKAEIDEELKREKEERERQKKERQAKLKAEKEAREKALKLDEENSKKKVEAKKKEVEKINEVESKKDTKVDDSKTKVEPQTKVDDSKTKVEPKLTENKKVDSIIGDKKPGYISSDKVEPKLDLDGSSKAPSVDVEKGAKLLKTLKFVPVVGTAVGIGFAGKDASEGYDNAEDILDIKNRKATTTEKVTSGAASVIEGIVDPLGVGYADEKDIGKSLDGFIKKATKFFSSDDVEPAPKSSGNDLGVDTNDTNDMTRQMSNGGQNITNNNITNVNNNNSSKGGGGPAIGPRPNNEESPLESYQRNTSNY